MAHRSLHNTPAHTFVKQGIYYFRKRVPSDLREHYNSPQIAHSLRTRSQRIAAARAAKAADQLDEFWYHMRLQKRHVPGKHLLRLNAPRAGLPLERVGSPSTVSVNLSEAVAVYLRLKGANRPKTFHRGAERSCGYLIEICGDREISSYRRQDANAFRDALIERGLVGSSVTRVMGTVRTIIAFAASESGIEMSNPFAGVYFDRQAGMKDRMPIPLESIREVQA
ncbi:DUF6538 domain-containing protein [Sulfitobacter sp. LCG007]